MFPGFRTSYLCNYPNFKLYSLAYLMLSITALLVQTFYVPLSNILFSLTHSASIKLAAMIQNQSIHGTKQSHTCKKTTFKKVFN